MALSALGPTSIRRLCAYDDLHASIVKSVRWRDDATFASCGNDGNFVVVDVRAPPGSSSAAQAHAAGHAFTQVTSTCGEMPLLYHR